MATIKKRENGKWQAKIRRKGYPAQSKTFVTKSEATKWARDIESDMDKSTFKSTSLAEQKKISDALEDYWIEELTEKKSAKTIRCMINRLKLVFDGLSLLDVTVHTIREYKAYRLEKAKGDTVRKEMALIGRMFKYAMNEWQIYLPNGNPVTSVLLPPKGKPRDRRFNAGEEERLLAYAKKYQGIIHDIIILAIETGMRRGEIANARNKQELEKAGYCCICWEGFNAKDSTLFLKDTKNGESRVVPLSRRAKEVILKQPRKLNGPIFDILSDSVGHAFNKVAERAGIDDFRFHDLRHEATSRLFEKGLQMMEVSAITGHKDLASLKRYTHLRATDLVKKLM
ncbi:site-specific integrase [Pseudoalteromonas nigrifaciens]|uniref:site-specific integrase n=1 Tax=Pseudoalteromonas TaxID=53246 RepID=UPI001788014B|nr:site-specific integrase [Pseudoalteromonas nigrifaciens]MBE0421206.1 site-specific integrase [Pseudoalteromonas nigrifaciens]